MKKQMLNQDSEVTKFLDNLNHPFRKEYPTAGYRKRKS